MEAQRQTSSVPSLSCSQWFSETRSFRPWASEKTMRLLKERVSRLMGWVNSIPGGGS